MRRFDWLNAIIAVLGLLLIILVIISVLIIVSPKISDRTVRNIRDSIEATTGVDPEEKITNAVTVIRNRARSGWEKRVKPLPDKISLTFKEAKQKRKIEKIVEADKKVFESCSDCHKDFLERYVFNHIYLNHISHLSKGLTCSSCHAGKIELKGKSHTKITQVKEETCLKCHKKTGDEKLSECSVCHTPGSIFTAADLNSQKTQNFLNSRKISSIMPSGFEHGKTEACKNCHETPEFCNKCHMVFHNEMPNWVQIHGKNILNQKYKIEGCKQCHRYSWCTKKCHPNPGNRRIEGGFEVPIVPLRGL